MSSPSHSSQILEMVDIFSDLAPEQLEEIYAICREKFCSRGAVIIRENTPSTEIYIILEGEMEVNIHIQRINQTRPRLIGILERGQSFGEIALVDQGLRAATVICHSDTCRLLEIGRDDLMDLMHRRPDIGFKVMYNLATDLCLKIRQATYRLQ